MMKEHEPALFNAVMEGLAIQPDGIYVDGTFGRGGHSFGILQKLGKNGQLMAMDKDPDAIASAHTFFHDTRFSIVHETFANLKKEIRKRRWEGKVNGILLDVGVASPQLEDSKRGFSFLRDGPLDMRMNPKQGINAMSWINQVEKKEIYHVIWNFGEERYAKRITEAIVKARKEKSITRTKELSEIIVKAYPKQVIKKRHPATRTFQAIRIFINRELDALRECLPQCLEALSIGGRLCVISFHSLEDRLVKRFMQKESHSDLPREIPILNKDIKHRLKPIGSLIRPTKIEIEENSRVRSARLRIMEKLI